MTREVKRRGGGLIRIRENVEIEVRDHRTGRVSRQRMKNLVVTAGLNLLRDVLDATQTAVVDFAVGTNATAPAAGDMALGAQIYRNVVSQRDKPANGQIVHRCFVPTSAANGSLLQEAGLFNALNSMFSRVTYSPIAKTNSISVTITWTHTINTA